MSIASHKRNRALGVTGRWTSTCFPASLEQISPRHSLSPKTYREYSRAMGLYDSWTGQDKRKRHPLLKAVYTQLAEEVGTSYDQITFIKLRQRAAFRRTIGSLLAENARVVVDILTEACDPKPGGSVHAVGVRAVAGSLDRIRLFSNWVPTELQGTITLDELFPHLSQVEEPPRKTYPFINCNVMALPAK